MITGHGARVANHDAWSADRETSLRRVIFADVAGFCTLVAEGVYSMAHGGRGSSLVALFALAWAGVFLWLTARDKTKLARMLVNKPAGRGRLTEWIELRPWQTEMCCACGRTVRIASARFMENPVDPGGGRFSVVCPCGVGYFKLRETVTS